MKCHLIAAGIMVVTLALPARATDIIDEWASVKVPPAPEVKPVTVDAKTTALLVIDMNKVVCSTERSALPGDRSRRQEGCRRGAGQGRDDCLHQHQGS